MSAGDDLRDMKRAIEQQVPVQRDDCPICGWTIDNTRRGLHCRFCGWTSRLSDTRSVE